MSIDFLIVGAGFSGIVCAEQLAKAGKKVLIIDKRSHIGGNAYDCLDEHGVLIHPYGPHIFHTNSKRIFIYLSRFTDWHFYEHRVLAQVDDKLYPIPINRITINRLYGLNLSENQVETYLDEVREKRHSILTSEDVVLNSVGRDLCEKFFRGYTRKQWGLDLSELSAGVAARIPTRNNDDDRYFNDTYQFMPAQGYTALFRRMLDHSNITVQLSTSLQQVQSSLCWKHLIYTGPIDAYFDYCFGPLPYRSLDFEHQHIADIDTYQDVGTINYPNDHKFTRITEFKHITGQKITGTSIVKEHPNATGDPYYPIPTQNNESLYKRYLRLAEQEKHATFVGRLAQYRYYNMDQAIGAALKKTEEILK